MRYCVTIIPSDSHDNVMINYHHTHLLARHRTPNIRTCSHQINISRGSKGTLTSPQLTSNIYIFMFLNIFIIDVDVSSIVMESDISQALWRSQQASKPASRCRCDWHPTPVITLATTCWSFSTITTHCRPLAWERVRPIIQQTSTDREREILMEF